MLAVKLLFGKLSSTNPEIQGKEGRQDGRASQVAYAQCVDRGALAGPKQVCRKPDSAATFTI